MRPRIVDGIRVSTRRLWHSGHKTRSGGKLSLTQCRPQAKACPRAEQLDLERTRDFAPRLRKKQHRRFASLGLSASEAKAFVTLAGIQSARRLHKEQRLPSFGVEKVINHMCST